MLIRVSAPQLPPPSLALARLVGDPASGSVLVLVGAGVAFSFERQDGEREGEDVWSGGEATTAGRGAPLSEAWLAQAREVAAEALRRAASAAAGEDDTLRCEECSRVLCAPELRGAGEVKRAYCGPDHVLVFASGRTLTVPAAGAAWWWRTSPPPAGP